MLILGSTKIAISLFKNSFIPPILAETCAFPSAAPSKPHRPNPSPSAQFSPTSQALYKILISLSDNC